MRDGSCWMLRVGVLVDRMREATRYSVSMSPVEGLEECPSGKGEQRPSKSLDSLRKMPKEVLWFERNHERLREYGEFSFQDR